MERSAGAAISMKEHLVGVSDHVWDRTRQRLDGLTDEELLWEPYPGCWSLRRLRDGSWVSDWVPEPPPLPPLTTLAWRMVHLIGCYGSARNSEWLGVEVSTAPVESWSVTPVTAADAIGSLEHAHTRWRHVLDMVDDDDLARRLGPIGGPYADETCAAFVLHMLDEVIHHGAEVAVMRDLYRAASGQIHTDPLVARLMRGDVTGFDQAAGRTDLVGELARVGRWDLVEAALERGCPPDGPAPTALHYAAAIGMEQMVDALLAAGADQMLKDPQFQATPSGWAQYFGHADLARRLDEPTGSA